jgi:hypothetical protein
MAVSDDILHGVTALGLGSGLGAIVTSVIAARSGKGKARADAADLLIGAAERVGKMNATLDEENRRLKTSLDTALDVVLQYAEGRVTRDEMMKKLRSLH